MSTTVEICNLALSHIGQRQIQTLDENSESARRCNQLFNMQKEAVFRAANWHFANKIVALALTETQIPGWNFIYQYPADCLFLRKLAHDFSNQPVQKTIPYKLIQVPETNDKGIAANDPNLFAEYTQRIDDSERLDSLFVEVLSYKLASALAQPLTGDLAMGKQMLQIYAQLVDDAKRINGMENLTILEQTSSFVETRGGG